MLPDKISLYNTKPLIKIYQMIPSSLFIKMASWFIFHHIKKSLQLSYQRYLKTQNPNIYCLLEGHLANIHLSLSIHIYNDQMEPGFGPHINKSKFFTLSHHLKTFPPSFPFTFTSAFSTIFNLCTWKQTSKPNFFFLFLLLNSCSTSWSLFISCS